MTAFAAFLMLGSGLLHAIVNAIVKASANRLYSRAAIDGTATVLALPVALAVPLPTNAWAYLLLSTLLHALYLACAIRSFDEGDLTTTYPVQRGSAPLVTTAIAFAVLGETVSLLQGVGIAVLCGAILYMASARVFSMRALGWALCTGGLIAACTVVDAIGVRAAPTPLSYVSWLFLLVGPTMFVSVSRLSRWSVAEFASLPWHRLIVAGGLSMIGYGSALLALSIGATAPLAALRETSVIAAYAIGIGFLGERHDFKSLVSVICVATGAVIIVAA